MDSLFQERSPQGKVVIAVGMLTAVMQTYAAFESAKKTGVVTADGGEKLLMALGYTALITAVSVFIADALSREQYPLMSWLFVGAPLIQSLIVYDLGGSPSLMPITQKKLTSDLKM